MSEGIVVIVVGVAIVVVVVRVEDCRERRAECWKRMRRETGVVSTSSPW